MLHEAPLERDKRPTDNVVLGGDHWTLHRTNMRKGVYGETLHDERLIEIDHRVRKRMALDTIIHECLHAVYPFLHEDSVEQPATEIAAILWKLGYRKVEE